MGIYLVQKCWFGLNKSPEKIGICKLAEIKVWYGHQDQGGSQTWFGLRCGVDLAEIIF